ncbi:GNAT family N-acetyltransferase [Atopococcus tabaci]|uniref:GNAT family N-acetyltransferase n=1 Tax=Atopococcus tabaci TaxID=269774 RepID=UPI00042172BE|nr:GNAT family N-acetyltransferase [Atopococcus tabaci]
MEFRWTTDVHSKIYEDALEIRKDVFIHEQNVPPHLEVDELESKTIHVVGYKNQQPVATARLYEKFPQTFKVQRVAVRKETRKSGIGNQLLDEIFRYAKKQGGKKLILDSQDHAIPFYEKNRYIVEGEGFLDAGIPHHFMYRIID